MVHENKKIVKEVAEMPELLPAIFAEFEPEQVMEALDNDQR